MNLTCDEGEFLRDRHAVHSAVVAVSSEQLDPDHRRTGFGALEDDLVRCEKLVDWVKKYNPKGGNIQSYHKLRPIPSNHINRLNPVGPISEEQNEGYY